MNTEIPTLVLRGDGSESFYSRVLRFINCLKNNPESMTDTSFESEVGGFALYSYCSSIMNDEKKEAYELRSKLDQGLGDFEKTDFEKIYRYINDYGADKLRYCVYIDNLRTITDLRFFVLLWQICDKKQCHLSISVKSDDDKFRISHYLYLVALNEFAANANFLEKDDSRNLLRTYFEDEERWKNNFLNHVHIFTEQTGFSMPVVNKVGDINLGKIIPLMPITWSLYYALSLSVNERPNAISSSQETHGQALTNSSEHEDLSTLVLELNANIYSIFLNRICLRNLAECALNTSQVVEMIQNGTSEVSLLGLFVFSAFLRYGSEDGAFVSSYSSDESLRELLQVAQSLADAILQLVENALEHARCGLLSLRVLHDQSPDMNTKYLGYSEGLYGLEISIDDYSRGFNITETFKRVTIERTIPKEMDSLKKFFEKLSLSDFFEQSAAEQKWLQYYRVGGNYANHYGLQLFSSIAEMHNGLFRVNSLSGHSGLLESYERQWGSVSFRDDNSKDTIPGTHYLALLPIISIGIQSMTGINARPSLENELLKLGDEITELKISDISKRPIFSPAGFREEKIKCIKSCGESLTTAIQQGGILVLSAGNTNDALQIEVFTKGLMTAITEIRQMSKNKTYIAIVDASEQFVNLFTRFFTLFYNKTGYCPMMKGVQIYISDYKLETEIFFIEESLEDSFKVSQYLANSKGEFNEGLEIIKLAFSLRLKQNKQERLFGIYEQEIPIAPFDLIIKQGNITLFEKKAVKVLNSNIQQKPFGCLMENVHIRAGSKIHITDNFYEGSLLFESNQFVTRFSYLIAKRINNVYQRETAEPLVLIGYETYSELLTVEVKQVLKKLYSIDSTYIIYEQQEQPFFRHSESIREKAYYVIIVPINTTLTTHGKILNELSSQSGIDNNTLRERVLLNQAIVLIRDSKSTKKDFSNTDSMTPIENRYWKSINCDKKYVETKYPSNMRVYFNVPIGNNWESPIECKACFPSNLQDEKPIIDASRDAVVPMVLAGLKESAVQIGEQRSSSPGSIDLLRNTALYGHFKRNNNHFQFYIETDRLFRAIVGDSKEKSTFYAWLERIREGLEINKTPDIVNTYDILVAPLHETNAAFLQEVNLKVFQEATLVLYVDADKEYRDNIASKYSNLSSLYSNLKNAERSAIINFHYVDDMIVSGTSIHRTKSLLRSLFPHAAFSQDNSIKVNLFKSVFVLLNRNSSNSIYEYIDTLPNYYAYINVNISSLRNHRENACAICQLKKDCIQLYEKSSTLMMRNYWKQRVEKYSVVDLELVSNPFRTRLDKYYLRLTTTHNINNVLAGLKEDKNDSQIAFSAIINRIVLDMKSSPNASLEVFISYIKVITRPFIIYRKSLIDAIFPFLINIACCLLFGHMKRGTDTYLELDDVDYISKYLLKIDDKSNEYYSALITVLTALSDLGSSFIFRKDVLERVLHKIDTEHLQTYAAIIKRVISKKKNENRSLFLEHLLLLGREPSSEQSPAMDVEPYQFLMKDEAFGDFYSLLFFENTKIICDAIDQFSAKLAQSGKGAYENIKTLYENEYYFDDFKAMQSINSQAMNTDIPIEIVCSTIEQMVELSAAINFSGNDSEGITDRYNSMLELIVSFTKAHNAALINTEDDLEFPLGSWPRSYEPKNNVFLEKQLEGSKSVGDSVLYNAATGYARISYLSGDKSQNNIYLYLYFDKTGDSNRFLMMLHGIKHLLVFYSAMVGLFEKDIENDEFRKLREVSIKNRLLSDSKAAHHSSEDKLEEVWASVFCDNIEREQNSSSGFFEERSKTLIGSLLQLGADSIISKLYVASFEEDCRNGKRKGRSFTLGCREFEFDDHFKNILEQITYHEKCYDKTSLTTPRITFGKNLQGDRLFYYPYEDDKYFYYPFLIAAVIQNAVCHGVSNNLIVDVTVDKTENWLVFKNRTDPAKSRSYDGITIEALKFYFHEVLSEDIETSEEQISGRVFYVTKLPIVPLAHKSSDN